MKQGSHIMLQRFVRSTVKTDPRPNLMELEPWLCKPSSLCAWMSRPGNIASMCLRNFESIAMMSSKWPWMGQSLTIQIWPSRSMICALISPTFSWTSTDGSIVGALRILLRASMTHFGHKESVVRRKPSGGFRLRPALTLLPGLQKRLVRPRRRERLVGPELVEELDRVEEAAGHQRQPLLRVF